MKKPLLEYNLQFFAGEEAESAEVTGIESGKEQEVADPDTEEVTEEEPQMDVNAIAAAARRKAEEATQKRIDSQFAERFKDYTNPRTGQAINSYSDYLDALDAQAQMQAEAELQEKGIDPNLVNQLINSNPAIRQANAIIESQRQNDINNQIYADVAELSKIDASIKTLQDVPAEVVQKSMETGLRLTDAYKIVNYGRVSETKQAEINQRAINQAKGKSHMAPVNGISTPDNLAEIPQSDLAMWKTMFPDKSAEELKKLYNKTI